LKHALAFCLSLAFVIPLAAQAPPPATPPAHEEKKTNAKEEPQEMAPPAEWLTLFASFQATQQDIADIMREDGVTRLQQLAQEKGSKLQAGIPAGYVFNNQPGNPKFVKQPAPPPPAKTEKK
jgi:hypothetical protein